MNAIVKTLLTVVGVPTLFASIYFGIIASDLYVSEAKFAVRSATGSGGASGLTALLAAPVLQSAGQDSLVVVEYTKSKDMLDRLREHVDLLAHYSDGDIDLLSRLDAEANQREVLDYYQDHVTIERDSLSDVMTVKVRAFDPDTAQRIAALIIELNEDLVNELSNRMEEDAMRAARGEMERAVQRVRGTAQDINRFQTANDSVSPQDESTALFGRLAGIETRISETRAELDETLSYMREDSADVVVLENRLSALERQLSLERGRMTSGGIGTLGTLIESFQPLVLEQQIAQQQYASSLAAFEAARIDAQRKKQYLITFVEPSLPDAASEPRRFAKVLTVAIFAFLAYLVGGLLWSALRDHIGH